MLIPQETILRWVTQICAACTSKQILPAWVPWGEFMRDPLLFITLLLPGQVKVGVEEVKDPDAPVPIPTDEVSLVGQAIHTFLSWPTHLVKSLSQQTVVSPAKPPQKSDPEVDDPLYLMTLTIPKLFLRPYQVTWDATVFGVFNLDFPLYIKHEDLFEITHGGQCHNISVLQLWIIRHWQMVVIGPKEHLVVWFCSLHNRSDNYLKGIINSAIKGLDDAPQPKSKAPARWIVVKVRHLHKTSTYIYFLCHALDVHHHFRKFQE
ncbi:hypothetical protein GmHk_07G020019 [Glycine max]|nr:hypothetical protein GmHk_07G020019 [Glycine max]KAH1242764.1 hypothetical protein GmHk_07G020019 [Glycine max]